MLLPLLLKAQDTQLIHDGLAPPIIQSGGPQYSEMQTFPASYRPQLAWLSCILKAHSKINYLTFVTG